jgi:hypothetical protein
VRHRVFRVDADALRQQLRRHDEQLQLLRQLHDGLHGGNDVPERPLQVPAGYAGLQRNVSNAERRERLRCRGHLPRRVPRSDGGKRGTFVQRPYVRDRVLGADRPALRHGLREYVRRRAELRQLRRSLLVGTGVLRRLVRVHRAVVRQRLLHGQYLWRAECVRRLRDSQWHAQRAVWSLQQRTHGVFSKHAERFL